MTDNILHPIPCRQSPPSCGAKGQHSGGQETGVGKKLAKHLGKRIAERRKQVGWTQEQLAERMRVDAETISRFERGVNLPSLPTLESMATVLKIGVGDLLSRTEPAQLDEATILATMICDLANPDRAFIVRQVGNWCEHLRSRSKR